MNLEHANLLKNVLSGDINEATSCSAIRAAFEAANGINIKLSVFPFTISAIEGTHLLTPTDDNHNDKIRFLKELNETTTDREALQTAIAVLEGNETSSPHRDEQLLMLMPNIPCSTPFNTKELVDIYTRAGARMTQAGQATEISFGENKITIQGGLETVNLNPGPKGIALKHLNDVPKIALKNLQEQRAAPAAVL